jgi:hypothetical protein
MGSIIPLSVLLFELSATWDDHRLMVAQIGAHQELKAQIELIGFTGIPNSKISSK